MLKILVLSAVHTASEAAGPAPRGSESRTRSIIAQHDPHQRRSLPVAPGQLRYSAPIGILALLSGLQRKGTHPRQPPGSSSCRGMHRCWLSALILRFSNQKWNDHKAHHLIVSCAFRCIQVRVTTHTVVFIAEPARSRAGARGRRPPRPCRSDVGSRLRRNWFCGMH